jgi:glycosyltransferase involved in cell wall biosynthesis
MMMAAADSPFPRVRVDGKFFRLGAEKFFVKGVTYGPFAPNLMGEHFPEEERAARDLALIRELGANLLRVYYLPPRWFVDLTAKHELKLLIDVPWNKHVCFLHSESSREEARKAVRDAARAFIGNPAVFALSLVNEIPPDIVRWCGAKAVADFIDELVQTAKAVDTECLCTMGNYPPTEFLRPQNLDFSCFNVYLHQQRAFENYLARLQMIADTKPLIVGEFGVDSLREGEDRQREIATWKIETAFRGGLAGAVVFSFTDDWFKDGKLVLDWTMGLTSREREPKPAFHAVKAAFQSAPFFPLNQPPMVSVVVASFNGARTLKACLESLSRLRYPSYEVVLVDDGSTDSTPHIASLYPNVRYLRHPQNQGLSAARNTGISAARGEIVAFTDSDCRADEDWLYYLVSELLMGRFVGVGGHNLLPPEDSSVAAAVMVSPGGPAHVMLNDRLAEHIPGCNMVFYKWALTEINGFDPVFRRAGDDVDVCWRLQERGYQIGFSPAGFVWHYRRSTVRDYLKQQLGYGEAEALLVRKHPEYFNWAGGGIWHGRIYSPAKFGVVTRPPIIYHGVFGSGLFQTLYSSAPAGVAFFFTSIEYYVLVVLPLLVLTLAFGLFIPLTITSLLFPIGVCVAAALQANLPRKKKRFWSRPLVALLFGLQPLVRGWARYHGRLTLHEAPVSAYETLDSLSIKGGNGRFDEVRYWVENDVQRSAFLDAVLRRLEAQGWHHRTDSGWNNFDVEVYGSRWSRLQLTTVAEAHKDGKQLIRCRLRPSWTLLAQTVFGALLGLELLVIGFVGPTIHWLWLLLLTLPLFVWRQHKEKRDLQRIIAVFLGDVAKQLGLTKIEPRAPAARSGARV